MPTMLASTSSSSLLGPPLKNSITTTVSNP
jgi:hypothetical protein